MISDKKALSGAKLDVLFSNIDEAIVHTGSIWKYSHKDGYAESADAFDKFFTEKINEYAKSLNAKQSVIAHLSVRDVVEPHKLNKFILLLDVKKYYESINFSSVEIHFNKAQFTPDFIKHIKAFYFDQEGFLRRGLRGSAMISELVGVKIDNLVGRVLYEKSYKDVVYTRYYDDLMLSSDRRDVLQEMEAVATLELSQMSLAVNGKKAKLKTTEGSMILGLRVYQSRLVVPKKFKRIERAREYELNKYYRSVNWNSKSDIWELKRFTGHVIGSLWYIVKNSDEDTSRYSERIEEYKEILTECDDAMKALQEEDDEVLYRR